MFEAKVGDLKWRVLARIEREQNTLAYSEAVSPHEKHHFYEGETPFADTKFCVATLYARKHWRGGVVPCSRRKATHLIVRPHLRWEFPKDLVAESGGLPWLHEMFELHIRRFFKPYAAVAETSDKTIHSVGVEVVMSARDIRENPGAPIELWDRAIASYLAKSSHDEELTPPASAGVLKTPLPTHGGAPSRWANGAAFQRRSLRAASYRWQDGLQRG